MPIYEMQPPPTIQLNHLQWLLVVLVASTASGFSTVSHLSSHPPNSFHFIFPHSIQQNEKAYIFHIHFHIRIGIHFHI